MNPIPRGELARKLIHITNLVIPLSYLWIFQNQITMVGILLFFTILSIFIEMLRVRNHQVSSFFERWLNFMMRKNETSGNITGATWVFVGAFLTVLLVPNPYAVLGLIFLSVGDTVAALIGIGYPLVRIGRKTLSGTLSGFVVCILAGKATGLPVSDLVIIFGASVAMVIELIPSPVNDNVTIPLSSGLAMALISSAL